jgi:predicted TPR repeat methyltransferase
MADAAALWRQAADIADDPTNALEGLATTLQRLHRPEEERDVWREIVRRQPQHPVGLHHLAALGEGGTPARASDAYITRLFNDFAPEFDAALAAIGYQGPQLLAQQAREVFGEPRGALDVLDAGCGTGLSGEPFRPWARKLVGLDLSEGMLAKARQRGIYDELIQAEMTRYLVGQRSAYDLVVFGDALTYFGELSAVFTAAAGALRPGGGLFCSLEAMSAAVEGAVYQLQRHGRYCHAREYVRRVCAESGLVSCRIDDGVLRHEAGEPVACLLVAARTARGEE